MANFVCPIYLALTPEQWDFCVEQAGKKKINKNILIRSYIDKEMECLQKR